MAGKSGDRSVHFPAIEKKHGRPVAFWLKELAGLKDAKYADQISFLRERHGFSQAHANALVMYARGSTTTRRVDTPEAYFRGLGGDRERLAREIFATVTAKFPKLEAVIAWNQPMLKQGKEYVFGLSAARNHLLIAAVGGNAVELLGDRLTGLESNKKTIRIPLDWKVDRKLLHDLVRARLADID
ncbi:MAG: DUF4287 domain-containing protein [Acidimicrobiales bacterium]